MKSDIKGQTVFKTAQYGLIELQRRFRHRSERGWWWVAPLGKSANEKNWFSLHEEDILCGK